MSKRLLTLAPEAQNFSHTRSERPVARRRRERPPTDPQWPVEFTPHFSLLHLIHSLRLPYDIDIPSRLVPSYAPLQVVGHRDGWLLRREKWSKDILLPRSLNRLDKQIEDHFG